VPSRSSKRRRHVGREGVPRICALAGAHSHRVPHPRAYRSASRGGGCAPSRLTNAAGVRLLLSQLLQALARRPESFSQRSESRIFRPWFAKRLVEFGVVGATYSSWWASSWKMVAARPHRRRSAACSRAPGSANLPRVEVGRARRRRSHRKPRTARAAGELAAARLLAKITAVRRRRPAIGETPALRGLNRELRRRGDHVSTPRMGRRGCRRRKLR